ncbi:MEKHLA domain-containing protein [Paenibacillus daejeonensis]|uniref:MEKHLA domain-containing protein n=1 Tax=Paenibacillus daejeonensis TaxID=135193 RepID=UPI000368D104|nr:MEKHLA domain-containing protein [Paenibacillus daejeonensis]
MFLEEIRGIGTRERHARLLLDSYDRLIGKPLLSLAPDQNAAEALERTHLVVLSHDTAPDPVLNYGNPRALELWEMSWESFTSTPSRLTAEPLEREAREQFLQQVHTRGFVDDYTGIRIAKSGRRFYIQQATVWNLIDEQGRRWGQAAAFPEYTYLTE